MNRATFLKTVSVVLGVVFLVSVLTVESHAAVKGNLAAKLPTVIDGSIEFAVALSDGIAFDLCTTVRFLRFSLEILFIDKDITPVQMYRGPPVRIL